MTGLRGRAPRGERLRVGVPHGHWRITTFVAGLRLSGMDAPMVIDGPINGESFLAYVRQVLVPTLNPGDVVIMDNLGSHKGAPAASIMARTEARMWLEWLSGALHRDRPRRGGRRGRGDQRSRDPLPRLQRAPPRSRISRPSSATG